jgi:hypothetical protein
MFSTQDVQDIFRSLPPQQDGFLPQFVISASGSGLVSGKSLIRQLERLMIDSECIIVALLKSLLIVQQILSDSL